ncbi:MAG: sterol desaturase family protein [Candidatus Thiodiazotropha sp. (ex Ctena orbiculata)]|nr:sterol desaturase family protein [Candidatus Thiodiazotropha taylori]
MLTTTEIAVLVIVALLGHVMALFWHLAEKRDSPLCRTRIYDVPLKKGQLQREFKNSVLTPLHAVLLGAMLGFGFFDNDSWGSFLITLVCTFIWAEIWHYFSHRAFHLPSLLWIHREHHRSQINSPLTAVSFSFLEKLIFDLGILLPLAIADQFVSVNFFGLAAWFIGYLVINSFSHANFEFRPANYNRHVGKLMATTIYHSLHHSRYTGNYGLGTRVLDRLLGTEWEDYERLYDRVCSERRPLSRLKERT